MTGDTLTGHLVQTAARSAGLTAIGIVELIIFLSWALLIVVLVGYLAVGVTSRGRVQRLRAAARQGASRQAAARQRASGPVSGGHAAGGRPSGGQAVAGQPTGRRSAAQRVTAEPARVSALTAELAAMRRADPNFDEQLLLDAALTATLLVFAATSTGNSAPISRLVTESFWKTPFGKLTRMTARDRRRENGQLALDQARGRSRSRWNIPLDYQPSVPELVAVKIGAEHRVSVRVSFDQLQAVMRPGATAFAEGAAATNFASAMSSIGKAVAASKDQARKADVSWLGSGGRYDLVFVRSADARTDASAALADRTCTACGAPYRSELATACAHCSADRALPWGRWRLAEATPV